MRVLITGVSGSGKSSLVHELRRRGFAAYDADDDGLSQPGPNGAWAWRADLVQQLLDERCDDLVFFAGCSDEQMKFSFDRTVLLTAPVDVIVERLRTRTTNPYGKSPGEIDRILSERAWVLPLLRKCADMIVETTVPVTKVADALVAAVLPPRHEQRLDGKGPDSRVSRFAGSRKTVVPLRRHSPWRGRPMRLPNLALSRLRRFGKQSRLPRSHR